MPEDVMQARLAAQHVARPALAGPRAVVRHLAAVQAQDWAAARWALALRTRKPSLDAVERAVARAEVVRTWPMRGTLHLVDARDAAWMVAALAPRALARAAGRRRELGLTDALLARARRTLVRALSGGNALARPDAYAALEKGGVPTRGQRGIHVLGHLAQEGTLCLGPHEGKQPTFVLLAEWARGGRAPEAPLVELARRYVRSHGPATDADFAWWTGATLGDARAALADAGPSLRETEAGWTAVRPRRAREPSPAAHLLPAFDELAVAYKDRSAALRRVGTLANAQIGLLSPSVVVDGQMVGTWGRTLERGRVRIALKPLVPWTRGEQEAVEAEAERHAAFIGLEPRIAVAAPARRLPERMRTRA